MAYGIAYLFIQNVCAFFRIFSYCSLSVNPRYFAPLVSRCSRLENLTENVFPLINIRKKPQFLALFNEFVSKFCQNLLNEIEMTQNRFG